MKRSNRLIFLIGIFLAVVAFVGVIYVLTNNTGGPGGPTQTDTTTNVVAAVDIPLGTTLTQDMVKTENVPTTAKVAGTPTLPSEVIGQTVTTDVLTGQQITAATFSTTTGANANIGKLLDTTKRAMAVLVDQVSGVGTLVKPGDHVDVVIGIAGADKFPVVTTDPVTKQPSVVPGINATSVKAILQNLTVVGALLPPPPASSGNTGGTEGTGTAPSLNGQTQIVLLAVTDQEAEVLRFGQIDGTITLVLRSPADYELANEETMGITLRQLVDKWAVIPPQVVETTLPKK